MPLSSSFIGANSSSKDVPKSVRSILNETFGIPSSFWSDLLHEASGFFGTQDVDLQDSELQGYSTFFRFLIKEPTVLIEARNDVPPAPSLIIGKTMYQDTEIPMQEIEESNCAPNPPNTAIGKVSYQWHELGFFTQWRPSTGMVVLCFDLPSSLQDTIRKALLESSTPIPLSHPFALHAILLEHIVNLYNRALWEWRDYVRKLEKHRATLENPNPDYEGMHEIARHIVHSSEMLDTAMTVVNSMLSELTIFTTENGLLSKQAERDARQTAKAFRHHITVLRCLHKRSQALEKRLQNEINLVCQG